MLFKSIALFLFLLSVIYVLTNVLATILLRIFNPLNKLSKNSKQIYLTFDDGIDAKYTPLLLDLLLEYNIKASFFILADTIDKNLSIFNRIKNEGHAIGLHYLKHKNQILQNPFEINYDFKKSIEIFKKHNISPVFYRPTWGHIGLWGLLYCKFHNLKIFLWNVIVGDWKRDTTSWIIHNDLYEKVKGNSVICLHDGRGDNNAPLKTIGALKEIVPKWLKEGYTFETIDNFK